MTLKRVLLAVLAAGCLVLASGIATGAREASSPDWRGSTPSGASNITSLLGPQFLICCGNEYHQGRPAAAHNPLHFEYLVVHHTESTGTRYVSGARVRPGSGPVASFLISSDGATDCCLYPDVAYNQQDDEYLAVWQHYNASQDRWEIYGRIIPWDGVDASLQPFQIAHATGANLKVPAVAWNSARNQYMVVWQAEDTSGQLLNVSQRRVGADGTLLGPAGYVRQTGEPGAPDIACNPAVDEYMVVWAQVGVSDIDIYGAILDWEGAVQGPAFAINEGTGEQQYPAVATNGLNRYLVAWQDHRFADWDVHGQLLKPNGDPVGGVLYFSASFNQDTNPDVTANGAAGQYMVVWQQSSGSGDRIMAELLDAAGSVLDWLEVAPGTLGDNRYPAVVNHSSGYFVTYEWQLNNPSAITDVYGRLWSPHAALLPVVVSEP